MPRVIGAGSGLAEAIAGRLRRLRLNGIILLSALSAHCSHGRRISERRHRVGRIAVALAHTHSRKVFRNQARGFFGNTETARGFCKSQKHIRFPSPFRVGSEFSRTSLYLSTCLRIAIYARPQRFFRSFQGPCHRGLIDAQFGRNLGLSEISPKVKVYDAVLPLR